MLVDSLKLMNRYPVRKTNVQKREFLVSVADYVQELGYCCRQEKNHIRIGADQTAFVLYARYDTSVFRDDSTAVLTVLEILRTLPQLHRPRVSAVIYEGSFLPAGNQTAILLENLNLGSEIRMYPSQALMADPGFAHLLKRCTGWFGNKQIRLLKSSGHKTKQLLICSVRPKKHLFRKAPMGPDMTTVNILRACISTLISAQ